MPELPEVETIRRDLEKALGGRRLLSLEILAAKSAPQSAVFLKRHLLEKRLLAILRRGKLLILSFEGEAYLLIHLKMTGQLIFLSGDSRVAGGHSLGSKKSRAADSWLTAVGGDLPNKHTRAVLLFEGGGRLYFNDLRRFGYLKYSDKKDLDRLIAANYGPEPLTPSFSFSAFSRIFSGNRQIKPLLLDQKKIAGLGNIYVDETLFASGIRPDRRADSLEEKEKRSLYQAINRIIKKAVEERGTTFSDYVDASGRRGGYSRLLKVYGRGGEACLKCGRKLEKTKISGRGTHFCPYCQK